MAIFKVILVAIVLVAIGIAGMAITILVKKGGKFPNTHVSGNKFLKRQKIPCAQTQDRIAQRDAWREVNYKKLSFTHKGNAGK